MVSLQRGRGKGAIYQGWTSSPKLALLPQLLAEDEWGPVRLKIKGQVANLTWLRGSWDTSAERAFLTHSISFKSPSDSTSYPRPFFNLASGNPVLLGPMD